MAANVFYRYDTWIKAANGPAVPGAQIYVCTQPANVTAAPPTPLAAIYSDSGGLVPITQPIITDGFGHADFYALPGLYTLVVALNGVIQNVYPDQSLGGVGTTGGGGGGTGGGLQLETNGTTNANQLNLNLYSSDGSVSLVNDSNGNTNIRTAGTTADFMLGAGIFSLAGISTSVSDQKLSDLDNRVYALKFNNPFSCNFSQLNVTGGCNILGGGTIGFGVYDESGSLIWQSGAINIPNVSDQNFTVTPSSPLIMAPGLYYLAWTAVSSGNTTVFGWDLSAVTFSSGSSDANIINRTATTFGYSPNAASGGFNMPLTLGVLTPVGNTNNPYVPAVMFQT